jgi:cell division protein FtsB
MVLTQDDIQLITSALQPQFDQMRKEMNDFRLEVRQLFKKQAESLSRALTDAVKMLADKQMTEAKLQELEDEIDDLKKQVKALQMSRHPSA